jgi:hypothetical protein
MGPDGPQISCTTDQRSTAISGGELARSLFIWKRADENTVVSPQDHVAPPDAYRGEKRSTPNRFVSSPILGNIYKGGLLALFYDFSNHLNSKSGAAARVETNLNSAPNLLIFRSFIGIFHHHHGSCHFFHNRARSLPSEESLIDRDSDVFDTIITVSLVSLSRANL